MTDTFNDYTTLRVVNKSETPFTMQWGRDQIFRCPGNSTVNALANAVFNTFGDPRSTDVSKVNIPTRQEERTRVEAKWGLDCLDLVIRQRNFDSAPEIEVYTQDGTRLYTPFEDPSGTHVREITLTESANTELLERMAQLETELASLRALRPQNILTTEDDDTVPEDDD